MKIHRLLAGVVIAWSCLVGSQLGLAAGSNESATNVTVITSDRLTFDYNKHYALFEGGVVVNDPKMKLKSETLLVRFSSENQVESILAKQNVKIWHGEIVADAGQATYDVKLGTIKLEISPRVNRGKNILEGETITFWRNENKMICEPQARLVIFSEEGGARKQLLGE